MSEVNQSCSKCGGKMEVGFLVDRIGGESVQASWMAGRPRAGADLQPETRGEGRPVLAHRCVECGHLEFSAPPI
jgi:hypothetical protein